MKSLETKTLNAGSPLLMMCVKETATFDILTVAATCPMVCAKATLKKKKKQTSIKNIFHYKTTNKFHHVLVF